VAASLVEDWVEARLAATQRRISIRDGAPGLKKTLAACGPISSFSGALCISCCNAPKSLAEKVTSDFSDMIYANTAKKVATRRKAFIRKWRGAVADSLEEVGEQLFIFTRLPPAQSHPDSDGTAIGGDGRQAIPGAACIGADHYAQGRQLGNDRVRPSASSLIHHWNPARRARAETLDRDGKFVSKETGIVRRHLARPSAEKEKLEAGGADSPRGHFEEN